jgi:hypothetical protein
MTDQDSFCFYCGKLKDKYDLPGDKYCAQCRQGVDKGDIDPEAQIYPDKDESYQSMRDAEAVENYVGF